MSRKKRIRFAELKNFTNVFELPKNLGGTWATHFGNKNPIVVELACGKGEYTIELARRFPEKNFIGIDIKGERIWVGAKTALEENLQNVAFVRVYINRLDWVFAENEISEIWITFPDPFLPNGDAHRRLTAPYFLNLYRRFLQEGAPIQLKTDSLPLYTYSQKTICTSGAIIDENISDLYALETIPELLHIQTTFEKRHLEDHRTITYLRWHWKSEGFIKSVIRKCQHFFVSS